MKPIPASVYQWYQNVPWKWPLQRSHTHIGMTASMMLRMTICLFSCSWKEFTPGGLLFSIWRAEENRDSEGEGRPPSQEKVDPPSQEKVDPSPPHALKAGLIKAPVVKLSQKVYSPPKNINILCSFSEHWLLYSSGKCVLQSIDWIPSRFPAACKAGLCNIPASRGNQLYSFFVKCFLMLLHRVLL